MSQPEQRPEDRTDRDSGAAEPRAADAPDEATDDVAGHLYTGAVEDKNQQP